MKKREVADRIKVGIFGILALIILTTLVFYIGSNLHSIGEKRKVSAVFSDVSGLKKGNAIRFSGVVVGTVEAIEILKDSAVKVTLGIDMEAAKFIKKDSRAMISTEGLLGSKYIKIGGGSPSSPTAKEGDQILTYTSPDLDELVNTFAETGKNAQIVTENLTKITDRINSITTRIDKGEGTLGALVADKHIYNGLEQAVNSFGSTGRKTNILTTKMINVVDTLQTAGENTLEASENFKMFTDKLNNESSTLGRLISDTAMAKQIDHTLYKIENTADEVTETSEEVRSSWIFRIFSKNKKNKNKHQKEAEVVKNK